MTERNRSFLLWLGLAIASSPTIASLAANIRSEPNQRYTLFALFLLVLAFAGHSPHADGSNRPSGWVLLALGLVAQLLGAASSSAFLGNVGLASAILGLGLVLGRPAPAKLALAIGLIPVPGFLYAFGSPAIESALGESMGWLLRSAGWWVESGGPLLEYQGRRFELNVADSGAVTAICCAEFLWYRDLRAGRPIGEVVRRAIRAGVVGFAAQPVLVLLALTSLPLGFPEVGRFLLSYGVPISFMVLVLGSELRSVQK